MKITRFAILGFLLIMPILLISQDKLLDILENEMEREISYFSKEEHPPYYISFQVDDFFSSSIVTEMGSLISSNDMRLRYFTNDLRVGDYNFDNTHKVENSYFGYGRTTQQFTFIPLEDSALAIKQQIWDKSEAAYKQALEAYLGKKEMDNADEQTYPDFSKEEEEVYIEPFDENLFTFKRNKWEEKLKSYSSPFLTDTNVFYARAQIGYMAQRSYFLSNEGTKIVQNSSYINLSISAQIKSVDGNIVPYSKSYYAKTPEGLPSHDSILNDIQQMKELLNKLAVAPIAEAYTGPAILSPKATGVFFHEIFGHRVEGHRLKDKSDGHTFKDKIGTKVLPKFINLTFDPTRKTYNGVDLIGAYNYDDEGVKSQKVTIIENGILKGYLMSRTPNDIYQKSNGHGRSQGIMSTVARQSNMFIETENPKSMEYLRKKLIKECKKQGKQYGYYFKEVTGGFTTTTRYRPDVFNIQPLEVYRIYVDGRPDELVRGVSLIGTPLLMFSEIQYSGDDYDVFSGLCGAESGSVPVSVIAPAMLIGKIETQKEPISDIELPILEDPYFEEKIKNTIKSVHNE